ncbi:hypothetical protein [Desulfacinum hydrothermale]|nr:hypothetical protein [Desulfacinum hydrothermale]
MNVWEQVITDPVPAIKAAMSEAIRTCSLSRDQIVDEMNRLMRQLGWTTNGRGQKVTTALLDKWVAPAASHVIPLRLLPLFCRVVQSNLPLEAYARSFQSVEVISDEDGKILQWARSELELRKAKRRAKRLAQEVGL